MNELCKIIVCVWLLAGFIWFALCFLFAIYCIIKFVISMFHVEHPPKEYWENRRKNLERLYGKPTKK
jgi:hypothetical protein